MHAVLVREGAAVYAAAMEDRPIVTAGEIREIMAEQPGGAPARSTLFRWLVAGKVPGAYPSGPDNTWLIPVSSIPAIRELMGRGDD